MSPSAVASENVPVSTNTKNTVVAGAASTTSVGFIDRTIIALFVVYHPDIFFLSFFFSKTFSI